jgi:2-dehydropantoate 2-reductase
VRLGSETVSWTPQIIETIPHDAPVLITCRVHQTNWHGLPTDALAAQNGVGQPRAVAVCFFAVDIDGGILHATGPRPRIVVGKLSSRWQPTLMAWRNAGIIVEEVKDVRSAQWEKVILNATVGPLCLSTGLTMAAVWQDPTLRQLTIDATTEGLRIAHSNGIACHDDLVDRASIFFAQLGDHHPSVVENAGELPWVIQPLLDAAQRQRLATPALDRIAALVAAASN